MLRPQLIKSIILVTAINDRAQGRRDTQRRPTETPRWRQVRSGSSTEGCRRISPILLKNRHFPIEYCAHAHILPVLPACFALSGLSLMIIPPTQGGAALCPGLVCRCPYGAKYLLPSCRPERPQQISPGQRPGYGSHHRSKALKGRHKPAFRRVSYTKTGRHPAGPSRLFRPFRAFPHDYPANPGRRCALPWADMSLPLRGEIPRPVLPA